MQRYRKIVSFILSVAIAVCAVPTARAAEIEIAPPDEGKTPEYSGLRASELISASAIVMDAVTGEVVFEKNAYTRRAMASTTKIMTALLALESGDIGREVEITSDMLAYDEKGSTKLGLKVGDRITMHDLICAMMLLSGNDAAQSVAVEIGGSYEGFASLMNEKAAEIGMFDTHFITPSGLDDEAHYSTAYDMALLASEAMTKTEMPYFTSMSRYTIRYGNPPEPRLLLTHNYLLQGQMYGYKGCDGLKTGYTDSAGYCLVSHVERDGVSLVCVTLGGWQGYKGCWIDHKALYNFALEQYTDATFTPQLDRDSVIVVGGTSQTAMIDVVGSKTVKVNASMTDQITKRINLDRFVYAPVSEGQVIGSVEYLYGTRVIADFPIIIAENVDCTASDWLSSYVDAVAYELKTAG